MKEKYVYSEIGIGNETFFSTEIEIIENNKEIKEYRVSKFIKPKHIKGIYLRIWIFKKVLIISTKEGFKIQNKKKNKLKILFGIQGVGL